MSQARRSPAPARTKRPGPELPIREVGQPISEVTAAAASSSRKSRHDQSPTHAESHELQIIGRDGVVTTDEVNVAVRDTNREELEMLKEYFHDRLEKNRKVDVFIDEEFPLPKIKKSYMDIGSTDEFFEWVQGPFQEAITKDQGYNGATLPPNKLHYIYKYNKLVGGVRFRQQRVKGIPCPILNSRIRSRNVDLYPTCYPRWTKSHEDTTAFGPNGIWKYSPQDKTHVPPTGGRSVSTNYDGGGFIVDIPVNNFTEFKSGIQYLIDNQWVDDQTRSVFVTLNVFNGNLNMYAVVMMMIEFSSAGDTSPFYMFRFFRLDPYVTSSDYLRMGIEIAIMIFLALFFFQELAEIAKERVTYFKQMWNVIDIVNLALFWFTIISLLAFTDDPSRRAANVLSTNYVNLEPLADKYMIVFNVNAFNILLTFIKLFKYLQVSQKLNLLWATLRAARSDLIAYVVFFMVVFVGFASMGYVLFGSDMFEFSDFLRSLVSCFQMVLGDLPYREMWRVNRMLGPAFYFFFVILVYFCLANMFVAIILDAYSEITAELRRKAQVKAFAKKKLTEKFEDYTDKQPPIYRRIYDATTNTVSYLYAMIVERIKRRGKLADESEWATKFHNALLLKRDKVMSPTDYADELCVPVSIINILFKSWESVQKQMVIQEITGKDQSSENPLIAINALEQRMDTKFAHLTALLERVVSASMAQSRHQ